MDKPYVPDKWKNLRLEIDKDYKNKDYIEKDFRIYEPRIIRTESILKNRNDVFKEKHKKCDCNEDCYKKPKVNFKCVIL
tara:strand:+ start:273 stop:509 length:237 start_codon:yes stop_codon:yes gene_type:complete